jgi:hypothetical protein
LREGVATADLASSAIPLRTAPAQQLQLLPSPALADKGWGQLESARQLRDFWPPAQTSIADVDAVYTFGMPRPGNQEFADLNNQRPGRAPTGRCMADIVATVAPTSLGFRHLGRLLRLLPALEIHLRRRGQARAQSAGKSTSTLIPPGPLAVRMFPCIEHQGSARCEHLGGFYRAEEELNGKVEQTARMSPI